MSDDMTRLIAAQTAIRAGKKQEARKLLHEELSENPDNFRAWLWLAGLAETARESMAYVREAERLNPEDPGVHKALVWAEQRMARQPVVAPPAAAAVAHVGTDDSAQRVDALRAQQRAASDSVVPFRGRRWTGRRVALAGLFMLIAAALLSAPLWGATAREMVFGQSPATGGEQLATTVSVVAATSAPVLAPTQPASRPQEISFVSGQFRPRAVAATSAAEPAPEKEELEATATPVALQPKLVQKNDNDPLPTWTMTPSPTFTPTATPTPVPTFVSEEQVVVGGASRPAGVGPNERWIDVNLTTQRLVAYEGDRAVFNSLVSSGTWLHPTVTGQFRVWLRYTAQTMDGSRLGYDYYLPNVPYVMYFYRDYALHGTYWHNNFGTPMSHGCVNLPTPAAEWIFNWSSIGTLVNVHY